MQDTAQKQNNKINNKIKNKLLKITFSKIIV